MYYIIENEEQLKDFSKKEIKKCYLEVIPFHDNVHPKLNNISLIYIRPLTSKKGYILSISHNESFSINPSSAFKIINDIQEIYVRDKKFTLYFIKHKNLYHIPLIHSLEKIKNIDFPIFNSFYKKTNIKDINRIIPISKHYEKHEKYFDLIKEFLEIEKPEYFNFYNESLDVFKKIEYNGIYVNINDICACYPSFNVEYAIKDSMVYTQYNLDTTTKRPSNKFNGINFAAIPKNETYRKCFIPKNDKFVDIDLDSYHPTIISKQINYDFGKESIHDHLAKLYNTDYNTSKELTFKQLYGGIFEEYKNIEFFKKTQKFIDNLWKLFNENGYVKCPISNFIFEKDKLENMTSQKLFNYLIQNIETSQNILLIKEILSILEGYNSKLVLYTYDSFLLDMDKNESYLLEGICNKFDEKELKYKIKYGNNYWDLKKF